MKASTLPPGSITFSQLLLLLFFTKSIGSDTKTAENTQSIGFSSYKRGSRAQLCLANRQCPMICCLLGKPLIAFKETTKKSLSLSEKTNLSVQFNFILQIEISSENIELSHTILWRLWIGAGGDWFSGISFQTYLRAYITHYVPFIPPTDPSIHTWTHRPSNHRPSVFLHREKNPLIIHIFCHN